MARRSVAAFALVMLVLAKLMVESTVAINCIDVDMALLQCIPYLIGQAVVPAVACCAGIRHLKDIATTTADQQLACRCMKEAVSHLSGIKDSSVSALPSKCNVPLPYSISASVDCSKIQ